MDAEQIRAAFIKANLNHALTHRDGSVAVRIAREIRLYFTWCADWLTDEDRQTIADQLCRLESRLRN